MQATWRRRRTRGRGSLPKLGGTPVLLLLRLFLAPGAADVGRMTPGPRQIKGAREVKVDESPPRSSQREEASWSSLSANRK